MRAKRGRFAYGGSPYRGRCSSDLKLTLPRPACSLSFLTMLTAFSTVSTGHLPAAELASALVAEAHKRFKSIDEGKNADYIPALAKVPGELFGVCVIGTSGSPEETSRLTPRCISPKRLATGATKASPSCS
jgi:hypothetical protein